MQHFIYGLEILDVANSHGMDYILCRKCKVDIWCPGSDFNTLPMFCLAFYKTWMDIFYSAGKELKVRLGFYTWTLIFIISIQQRQHIFDCIVSFLGSGLPHMSSTLISKISLLISENFENLMSYVQRYSVIIQYLCSNKAEISWVILVSVVFLLAFCLPSPLGHFFHEETASTRIYIALITADLCS